MSIKPHVLQEVLSLQPGDRADLAAALLASLDESEDAGAHVAWDAEVARREGDLASGKVKTLSTEEFWSQLGDDAG